MTQADPTTRDDFRSSWSRMTRQERRRAIRALGVFVAVDLVGVNPAEVVLSLKGPTDMADRVVRRSLDTCRDFFRPRSSSA